MSLILRNVKGSPLTYTEMDDNFEYLENLSSGGTGSGGMVGPIGPTGATGNTGASGTSGINGTSGVNGSSGTSGINGTSGVNGSNGSSGTSGVNGSQGPIGPTGPAGGGSGGSGTSGTSGVNGSNGSDGSNGTSGVNGSNGTSGTSGSGTADLTNYYTKEETEDLGRIKAGKNIFDDTLPTTSGFINESGVIQSNPTYITTDFIPVDSLTNYSVKNEYIRYAEYDSNKDFIPGTYLNTSSYNSYHTTVATAKYIRITFKPQYLAGQQIEIGEVSTDYVPYVVYIDGYNGISIRNADKDVYSKDEVDSFLGTYLQLPKKIYATVGLETNLYYDQFMMTSEYGKNHPDVNVFVKCSLGKTDIRSWRVVPTIGNVGNHTFTIEVYGKGGAIEYTSDHTLVVVANTSITQPTKKLLMIGDSNTDHTFSGGGSPVSEQLHTNLIAIGGNTPEFHGTHNSRPYLNEGRSGYDFGRTLGRTATRLVFDSTIGVHPLRTQLESFAIYTGGGTNYVVRDGIVVNSDGSGYIMCEYNNKSQTFPMTLTLSVNSSTDMPATLTINSIEQIGLNTQSPYRNNGTGVLDFTYYREKILHLDPTDYIDIITIDLGLNDANIPSYSLDKIKGNFTTNAITFYDAIIADNPNAKVVFILPKSNGSGSVVSVDNANYRMKIFKVKEAILENFDENPLRPNAVVSQAGLGIDRWYGYPTGNEALGTRITGTHVVNTNALHPNDEGYYQHVDGMTGCIVNLLRE